MKLLGKLPQGLTRAFGKVWMRTKNASPEFCVGTGIACGFAALVMVGVKTWKGKDKLAEDVKAVKNATKKGAEAYKAENPEAPVMPEEERKNYLIKRSGILAKDICKTYWIPIVLGFSSAGLVWGGRTLLRKELSAITAAYAALSESYAKYRQRVIQELGPEKDQEFQYGYSMEELVDAETGIVEKHPVIDKEKNLSEYAFWFDEGDFDKNSGTWTWKNYKFDRNPHVNLMTVIEKQNEATYELNHIGYLSLEKVATEWFGIDPDTAKKWHDYGWVWQEGRRNVVEFGVLEGPYQLEVNKGFTDPRCSQNICLINPNVDGYIGYVYENYKKYDSRYGKADLKHRSIRRRMLEVINRRNAEEMGDMIERAMKH